MKDTVFYSSDNKSLSYISLVILHNFIASLHEMMYAILLEGTGFHLKEVLQPRSGSLARV